MKYYNLVPLNFRAFLQINISINNKTNKKTSEIKAEIS